MRGLLRSRSGIALPLVLVALVVTSVLVSALLVTSSMEVAISTAHRDATGALYRADTGLRSYVASVDWSLAAGAAAPVPYLPPGAPPQDAVQITVSQLAASTPAGTRIFSVLSSPLDGNTDRAVAALVETAAAGPPLPPPGYRVIGWFEVVR